MGIVISAACLYLVFKGIEGRKLVDALKSANYVYLPLAALVNLSTFWLRAERWKYLLEPVKRTTTARLFPITTIGFMATNLLPARAGEFVRAYAVARKEGISPSASFATIVLERVLDSIVIITFFVIILFLIDFNDTSGGAMSPGIAPSNISPGMLKTTGMVFSSILIVTFVLLLLLKLYPITVIGVINKVLFPLPEQIKKRIAQILESFSSGLQVLKKGNHILPLLFWSVGVWGVSALSIWFTLMAFNLHLPFHAAGFILVLVAFAVALPSSPGFIGPFHAATSAGLIFFSVDKSIATGVSLIVHAISVVPVTLLGLFYLWMENISFSEIKRV